MHPAFSVIFLTTLLGAGQGLFLALFTAQSYALFDLLPAQSGRTFYAFGSLMALVFLGAGLAGSFFHLGRPERAWRAMAQWRTSWLSRETLVLPAFMGLVFLYGVAHWADWKPVVATLPSGIVVDATVVLGVLGTILAFALFLCTAMIYACLPFLREWHSPLTVINYLLMGSASGFTLTTAFSVFVDSDLSRFFATWAIIITLAAFVSRGASLVRNARLKPKSTLQTAIGIKHPRIAQKSQGFMGGSFNTREFFHGRTRFFLRSIKWLFVLGVFVAPILLLSAAMSGVSMSVSLLAFVVQYLGLVAERWFFFAEANHPQNLYYQAIA
jgi:sulfite dehydrogenase (quinone) subunit SoeC